MSQHAVSSPSPAPTPTPPPTPPPAPPPAPTPTPPTTLVAVPAPKPVLEAGDRGYILPTTVEEAYRLAVAIVNAHLAPKSYETGGQPDPQKVLIGLLTAMELGLPPLTGLRNIAIVNGRPSVWGDGAMALVQRTGALERHTVEKIGTVPAPGAPRATWADDYGYRVTMWRRGQAEPYVGEFTVGTAKLAGLWSDPRRDPWQKYPDRMLFNRARAMPLRDGFADALAGIAIREEVEDIPEDAPKLVDTSFLSDAAVPADDPARAGVDGPPQAASLVTGEASKPVPAHDPETSEATEAPADADDPQQAPVSVEAPQPDGQNMLFADPPHTVRAHELAHIYRTATSHDHLRQLWADTEGERKAIIKIDPTYKHVFAAELAREKDRLAAEPQP